jgi:putative transposase
MREWQSQTHVQGYGRYHVVIVPKYRRKSMFGVLRKEMGRIFKELCRRFEIDLIEGHVMPDHVHMCLGIPPKYSVANTVGQLKGKSAIMIHQKYGRKRNFVGLNFWARGYCVSTVGLDEAMIRAYIRNQEDREKQEEQLHNRGIEANASQAHPAPFQGASSNHPLCGWYVILFELCSRPGY